MTRTPRNVTSAIAKGKSLGHAPISSGAGQFRCERCEAQAWLDQPPGYTERCTQRARMTRAELERAVWSSKHRDYKSVINGVRHVLFLDPKVGTVSSPLLALTRAQLIQSLPHAIRTEQERLDAAVLATVTSAGK